MNSDGSVTYLDIQQFSGSWYLPGGSGGGGLDNTGVTTPSLPPGSTINSATFTIDNVQAGASGNTITGQPAGFDYTITGDGSSSIPWTLLLNQSGECGPFGAPASGFDPQTFQPIGAALSFSFMPCSTAATYYIPLFYGTDDLMFQWTVPSQPGIYDTGVNAYVIIDYTIAVDYTVAPEPRTYALLVGLGLIAILVSKKRTGDRGSV